MVEIKIRCSFDAMLEASSLKPHPKNRNLHTQEQIKRLSELIKYQGVRAPIVVSKTSGFIVKGHGTLKACELCEMTMVPVSFQDFESSEQEYAFVQSDNAIAHWASLDLALINEDLADLGPDFDVDFLGIADFKLDLSEKVELPELSTEEPGFQQRTFVLSNEQNDILDDALEKAKREEDCSDDVNQNSNGNALAALLKRYVYG